MSQVSVIRNPQTGKSEVASFGHSKCMSEKDGGGPIAPVMSMLMYTLKIILDVVREYLANECPVSVVTVIYMKNQGKNWPSRFDPGAFLTFFFPIFDKLFDMRKRYTPATPASIRLSHLHEFTRK
jgi:hypothetical protein